MVKISYDKLWKLLIDKKMNRTDLGKITGLSTSTIAKLGKNEYVAMPVIGKICKELECNIEDIMEFIYK